jgi:hypothetical protein
MISVKQSNQFSVYKPMDNNQQPDKEAEVKTYISESNQNRISDTLRVKEESTPYESAAAATQLPADEMSTAGAVPPQGDSEEPEGLSAEATEWPPITATMDAEEVAGRPVGEVYGQEGDLKAKADDSDQEAGDLPEEAIGSPS